MRKVAFYNSSQGIFQGRNCFKWERNVTPYFEGFILHKIVEAWSKVGSHLSHLLKNLKVENLTPWV